jgi:hypothetical protein
VQSVKDEVSMKQFREYSLFIDYSSGPEEGKIYHALSMILATPVGKLLLDALSAQSWIVPMDEKHSKMCACAGLTLPTTPDRGAGSDKNSTVYLEVTDQALSVTKSGLKYQYYSDDDRLFHELVHACRMGRIGYYKMLYSSMTNYLNPEEFLAVHMQNVYLSYRNNPRFYLNTNTMRAVSKGDAYVSFVADKEALKMFDYFVKNDPFAAKVANLKLPVTSFNPWRDYGTLSRI